MERRRLMLLLPALDEVFPSEAAPGGVGLYVAAAAGSVAGARAAGYSVAGAQAADGR